MRATLNPLPRIVVAAPSSGCGKTTVAVGVMAALAESRRVQPFKVGPDYIDPMYHTLACGRPSRNLDTWMVSPARARALFDRAVADADVAVIEGVMGLFDGYAGDSESGSTAEVAKLLGAPVILVMDVSRMARSAGAIALGCQMFDPALKIAGVICNYVGGARHAEWARQAIESTGIPVLGCLPRAEALRVPERHLGLHTAVERQAEAAQFARRAAELLRAHVDVDRLLANAVQAALQPLLSGLDLRPLSDDVFTPATPSPVSPVRIAVARDEAFCFYYEDNLDLLRAAGAEIVFFSPLRDVDLPAGAQGVYIGGGYPELYAEQLASNLAMRAALRRAHQAGLPIYAECGGLMLLTERLVDLQGRAHEMAGLVPGIARMQSRLSMGYRRVVARRDTLLLPAGHAARGHEFHYSTWETPDAIAEWRAYDIAPRAELSPAEETRAEGFAFGNLLASYVHLHFAAEPELARRFVAACRVAPGVGEGHVTGA